jgi:hypothetical protein
MGMDEAGPAGRERTRFRAAISPEAAKFAPLRHYAMGWMNKPAFCRSIVRHALQKSNHPMKIHVLVSTACALLLALAPASRTHAQDGPPGATFDLFYNNLADDGDWYNTPEYGYVWQPNIAVQNTAWRPYADGYWAQTDSGWTWVSYESFGWATYHYGRWTRLNDIGWAWVPGYDWGPGWVSWRTNNDYVGWAPLPPQPVATPGAAVAIDYNTVEPVSEGYSPAVDVNFDIGPQNYCFVTCANFGAPVLSGVFLPPQQNFTIIQNTVNVTNIYYNNVGGQTVVYNRGGPDFNFISTRVTTPIQRLRLEPNTDPNYLRGNHPAGFNPTQVHNGVLQVAAPPIARGPVNFQQVKPPRVKATLAKAEVVHGWSGVSASPQQVEQAREKLKQQAQTVPKREPNGNIPMPARPGSKMPVAAEREPAPAAAPLPVRPPAPAAAVSAPEHPLHPAPAAPATQPREAKPALPAAPAPEALTPAERAARKQPQPEREARPNAPAPEAAAPHAEPRAPEVSPAVPKPAVEHAPEPRPAVEHAPEPKPAVERAPQPKPAFERAPEPKPAVERAPEPKPAVEHAPEPKPAVEHAPEPRPAVERAPQPKPAVEHAPEPRPAPAHAAEAKPSPAHEADHAKAETTRREEAAKPGEEKKNTPPQ